ncbi:hypothetical protein JCM3774_003366 [Rhodotorula dairenensis]
MDTTGACTDCQPAPATSVPPVPAPVASSSQPSRAHAAALVDATAFEPPALGSSDGLVPRVVIEFCDRCRWLHRATWTQTELFLTFPSSDDAPRAEGAASDPSRPAPGLRSISLVPRNAPDTGGRFRVWLLLGGSERPPAEGPYATGDKGDKGKERWRGWELVWDRKIEGRFPEMKELKQRIRNLIAPSQSLGHSDKPVASALAMQPQAEAAPAAATPANTTAEMPQAGPRAVTAEPTEIAQETVDLSALAEQPLKPLTAEDFAPRYRCM